MTEHWEAQAVQTVRTSHLQPVIHMLFQILENVADNSMVHGPLPESKFIRHLMSFNT